MAGLTLGVGGYGALGNATGALPVAANQPSGTTIGQKAFGIGTGQTATGPRTAGWGTMGIGIACTLALVWLWHTLPR